MLAHSATTILVVRPTEGGLSHVTAWEPASDHHRDVDPDGAAVCATIADGKWARVDRAVYHEDGIPSPWVVAWDQIYQLVPELQNVGLKSMGMVVVIGDPRQRVRYARERADREVQRRRSGGKRSESAEHMKDVGPLGLGGCRGS